MKNARLTAHLTPRQKRVMDRLDFRPTDLYPAM